MMASNAEVDAVVKIVDLVVASREGMRSSSCPQASCIGLTIRATAAQLAPWYVVPPDHKWFTRLIVAGAIVEAVDKLGLSYPQVDAMKKKELAMASEKLDGET